MTEIVEMRTKVQIRIELAICNLNFCKRERPSTTFRERVPVFGTRIGKYSLTLETENEKLE